MVKKWSVRIGVIVSPLGKDINTRTLDFTGVYFWVEKSQSFYGVKTYTLRIKSKNRFSPTP